MKLRTEMLGGGVRSPEGYFLDEAHLDYADGHILLHDAMAAHALLQALGEACASTWHDYRPSEEITGFIKQRAAEILAGWMGEDMG